MSGSAAKARVVILRRVSGLVNCVIVLVSPVVTACVIVGCTNAPVAVTVAPLASVTPPSSAVPVTASPVLPAVFSAAGVAPGAALSCAEVAVVPDTPELVLSPTLPALAALAAT